MRAERVGVGDVGSERCGPGRAGERERGFERAGVGWDGVWGVVARPCVCLGRLEEHEGCRGHRLCVVCDYRVWVWSVFRSREPARRIGRDGQRGEHVGV